MTHSRPLKLPAIGLLLLAFAACDDGTSPADLGDLRPFDLAVELDQLNAPLQASRGAIQNLRLVLPTLIDAGVELVSPVTFPAEVAGRTFVYDPDNLAWEVDETREDAPADGVRVVWYAIDGSNEIADPLTERGYIELRPGDDAALDPVVLEIVDADGTVTLMDFEQWYLPAPTGGEEAEEWGAAGFYADGTTTVDFSLDCEDPAFCEIAAEEPSGSGSFDAVMEDSDTRYHLQATGTVDAATEAYDLILTATAVSSQGTTVMEINFEGAGQVQEQAGGTIRHDGEVVLDIVISGSAFEFTKPGGGSLPAGQASEVNLLFRALTLNGFNLLYQLPLFFLIL